ncbi:MAG: putative selenium-dependent hydroxylase accessory protein YqeC [Chloroflexi bacterium]|nr:putative selenium-dependent hydroxylase accessory protein YqeC [Chloroflexota bacterium]
MMELTNALGVYPGSIIAFIGAGGKTRAMMRLAEELAGRNQRVVSTTTTYLRQDELRLVPQRVGFGHGMRLPATLPDQIADHGHVFVFTKIEGNGDVRGVRPNWLDDNLVPAAYYDYLLVEADESRRLSLKAPSPHEPAIPSSVTIAVPMVGLDILGKPLDAENVYGAELIQRLLRHPFGAEITPRLVAAMLLHPQLGMKGIPRSARVAVLLNKVSDKTLPQAKAIARILLSDLTVERVLIAAVNDQDPVWEMWRRVGAVVLAAGQSIRMGRPKMLLKWGGQSIIQHVATQVAATDVSEVVVITGQQHRAITEHLDGLPMRTRYNPDHDVGEMLSSFQLGLRAMWHTCDAVLVVLGDQPFIDSALIQALLQAYESGLGRIIVPSYQNKRGHPILIDKRYWQDILELPSGSSLRDFLHSRESEIYHVEVATDAILKDIDTPEDYHREKPKWPPEDVALG